MLRSVKQLLMVWAPEDQIFFTPLPLILTTDKKHLLLKDLQYMAKTSTMNQQKYAKSNFNCRR